MYAFHKALRVIEVFSRSVKRVPISSCCSYTVLIPVSGALTYKMILSKIGTFIGSNYFFTKKKEEVKRRYRESKNKRAQDKRANIFACVSATDANREKNEDISIDN